MKTCCVTILASLAALASVAADRSAWFQEARFGMFIHWGIYSIPARGEWTYASDSWKAGEYEAFAKVFNPTNYNPREWAKLAKRAGMKYAVLTSRHHGLQDHEHPLRARHCARVRRGVPRRRA